MLFGKLALEAVLPQDLKLGELLTTYHKEISKTRKPLFSKHEDLIQKMRQRITEEFEVYLSSHENKLQQIKDIQPLTDYCVNKVAEVNSIYHSIREEIPEICESIQKAPLTKTLLLVQEKQTPSTPLKVKAALKITNGSKEYSFEVICSEFSKEHLILKDTLQTLNSQDTVPSLFTGIYTHLGATLSLRCSSDLSCFSVDLPVQMKDGIYCIEITELGVKHLHLVPFSKANSHSCQIS